MTDYINEHINEINEYKSSILIIDDDEFNLFFIKKCVQKFTDEIFTAADGESGYLLYLRYKPELVITDISMPFMDGLQLAAKIRLEDSETPIIIQTAIDDKNVILKAIDLGITNYLVKPLNAKAIENTISKVLEQIYFKNIFQRQHDFIQTLSLALKFTSAIVIIANLKGNVVYANDKFYTFTKYNRDELTKLEIDEIFKSKTSVIGKVIDKIALGQNKLELILKLENGNTSWTSTTFNKITDANNNTNLVFVLDDITEKKLSENNLIQNYYQLEEKVLERTSELLYEKEKAVEANKAKDLFMAKVSHELRTPLNGIIGISDIILKKDLKKTTSLEDYNNKLEQINKYVKIIKNSGEGLLRIINDIIDYSRLETKKFQLIFEDFDLIKLLYNISDNFLALATSKDISFNLIITNEVPQYIFSDKTRITQILYNILSNSLKFTETGSITLIVDIDPNQVSMHNDKFLKFEIDDTGIGIEAEKKSLIFDAFAQIENTYTRKFSGSGLGLSITKELVDIFGGYIDFSSELGVGTFFQIQIPVKISVEDDINKLKSSENINTDIDISIIDKKKILIIEDSEINQEYYKELLLSIGGIVTSAYSYSEALEYRNKEFDIILLDCHLKETKVDTLFQNFLIDFESQFVNNYPLKSINYNKLIIITADLTLETTNLIKSFKTNNILYKPIDQNKLYTNIINILNKNIHLSNNFINISSNANKVNNIIEVKNNKQSKSIRNMNDLFHFFDKINNNVVLFEKIKFTFLTNINSELEELRSSIINNDFIRIFSLAHKLKSEISNFGYLFIIELLRNIELNSKNNIEITLNEFNVLEEEINNLINNFKEFEFKK